MIPLQSANEYFNAIMTREVYRAMKAMSDSDRREYAELDSRIIAYQANPTTPNTITHEGGNIDNTVLPEGYHKGNC